MRQCTRTPDRRRATARAAMTDLFRATASHERRRSSVPLSACTLPSTPFHGPIIFPFHRPLAEVTRALSVRNQLAIKRIVQFAPQHLLTFGPHGSTLSRARDAMNVRVLIVATPGRQNSADRRPHERRG